MRLIEKLKQQYNIDGASRKEATPKRIAERLGKEKLTMERGLRLYPVTEKIKEQKLKGGKCERK
jgi:hypothetical protein